MSLRSTFGIHLSLSCLSGAVLVGVQGLTGGLPWASTLLLLAACLPPFLVGVGLTLAPTRKPAGPPRPTLATALAAVAICPATAIAMLATIPELQHFPQGLAVLLLPLALVPAALLARAAYLLLPRSLRDFLHYFS